MEGLPTHRTIGVGALLVYVQTSMGFVGIGSQGNRDVWLRWSAGTLAHLRALDEHPTLLAASLAGSRTDASGLPAHEVAFEGVSFRYPGTDRMVLDGLDLRMTAWSSLAIVGANGAGKTTLVKLLARLYDPGDGRISVDDVDLRDFAPSAWRDRVAVIFQDFARYELPARDNVGFGLDEEVLDWAADRAGADSVRKVNPVNVVEAFRARALGELLGGRCPSGTARVEVMCAAPAV